MVDRRTGILMVVMVASVLSVGSLLRADTPVALVEGRPRFDAGEDLGYFLWRDDDTWKLRWMTFGAQHRFTGRITAEGGEIREVERVDPDTERKIIAPGRPGRAVRGPRGRVVGRTGGRAPVVASREEDIIVQETDQVVRFNTRTDDDLDGVDFEVSDGTRVLRFVLEIDGVPRPAEIEVGRNNVRPNEHPVVVRIR